MKMVHMKTFKVVQEAKVTIFGYVYSEKNMSNIFPRGV